MARLTQNVSCSTTTPFPTNADFAFLGNWYDPATLELTSVIGLPRWRAARGQSQADCPESRWSVDRCYPEQGRRGGGGSMRLIEPMPTLPDE
jgi:hypothetical protein